MARPVVTSHAPNGMVCSVDHLASSAGVAMLRAGGSAVDAAIATSAVLTVTSQHMCGLGGDLWALVHEGAGPPTALCSAGRAGSGSDPEQLRAEGHARMPFRHDVRSSTVPGCVDGWIALHERYGRLPLADVLAPAAGYAEHGFPASPLLTLAVLLVADVTGADDYLPAEPILPGRRIRRPLVAETLRGVGSGGRDSFYGGRFGEGLVQVGAGLYTEDDLARSQAEWVEPLSLRVWGHDVWTVPAPSQGYLTLVSAAIAEVADLPDPDDAGWAHLLVESTRWAGHDRNDVLYDGADPASLLDQRRIDRGRAALDPDQITAPSAPSDDGDTIYLCAVDGDGMAVSLIQSNASDWGLHLVVPGTGIFLHNRGVGFRLEPGHPGELAPGKRPLHTLAPALVTTPTGDLHTVLGTMGGDLQPQVVLQLLARLLVAGQDVGAAISAPRWALGDGGFYSWDADLGSSGGASDGAPATERPRAASVAGERTAQALRTVGLEVDAPPGWAPGLEQRGHVAETRFQNFGHAHAISLTPAGMLAGCADPRAEVGAALGL